MYWSVVKKHHRSQFLLVHLWNLTDRWLKDDRKQSMESENGKLWLEKTRNNFSRVRKIANLTFSKKNLSWIYPGYQELQILFPKDPQFFVGELLRLTLTGGRLNTREKDGVLFKVDGTNGKKMGNETWKKTSQFLFILFIESKEFLCDFIHLSPF